MWNMMESRGVLSIIFDLDNTLVDTAGAGHIAIQKVNEWIRKMLTLPIYHGIIIVLGARMVLFDILWSIYGSTIVLL